MLELYDATKQINMKLDLIGAPLEDMNLDTNFIKFGKPATLGTDISFK